MLSKNYKYLPGKPDIVLTKYQICIFVDSEFFHGKGFVSDYDSKKYNNLKDQLEHTNNSGFWLDKIQKNIERDCKVEAELRRMGWLVIRFWSKDVLAHTEECVRMIEEVIFAFKTDDL